MAELRKVGKRVDIGRHVWGITCDCGYSFLETSTLLAPHLVFCPKCGKAMDADYGAMTIRDHSYTSKNADSAAGGK